MRFRKPAGLSLDKRITTNRSPYMVLEPSRPVSMCARRVRLRAQSQIKERDVRLT